MRTADLIVGKKYTINGMKCLCIYNGLGIKAKILEGDLKGKQLTTQHVDNLEITEA